MKLRVHLKENSYSIHIKKGTLNVCADKVLIISSSTCESGTINSSTQDDAGTVKMQHDRQNNWFLLHYFYR